MGKDAATGAKKRNIGITETKEDHKYGIVGASSLEDKCIASQTYLETPPVKKAKSADAASNKRLWLEAHEEHSVLLASKNMEEVRVIAGARVREAFLSGRLRQVLKEVCDDSIETELAFSKTDLGGIEERVQPHRAVALSGVLSCS